MHRREESISTAGVERRARLPDSPLRVVVGPLARGPNSQAPFVLTSWGLPASLGHRCGVLLARAPV